MTDTLKGTPELFETVLGESLVSRTESIPSFRLGPPDLCHIVKVTSKSEVTSYHYVSGVDASSAGALAAYVRDISGGVEEPSKGWFSNSQCKVKSAVYCCFNAFSKLDVRVECRFPGGVRFYAINRAGKRVDLVDVSSKFWHELFVSAILRSISEHDIFPPSPIAMKKIRTTENAGSRKEIH